jgi:carbonic anhydrase/acetyltransferase-like protein (isoleucine patch superfamily)
VYVASSAILVGDVRLGRGCVIDHGAMLVATGAPIALGERVVVMPGAVIRSTGGDARPFHGVSIGDDCLIGPQAALTGCELGDAVYVATQVMVFHGASVGSGSRLAVGSIVHARARLEPGTRVGMRQFAMPEPDGGPAVVTGDLDEARALLARADFFGTAFALEPEAQQDLPALHRQPAPSPPRSGSGLRPRLTAERPVDMRCCAIAMRTVS